MKNTLLTITLVLTCYISYAQTNTFPSSGNVGIGTTSPVSPLDVNGILSFGGRATLSNNAAISSLYTGTSYFQVVNATGSTNLFTVLHSGNVGIGTANPSDKTDIWGALRLTNVSNTGQYTRIYTAGMISYFDGNSNSNVYNGVQHIFQESGTEYMRISTSGSVGIGTASPGSQLDIFHIGTGTTLRVGGIATGTSNDAGIDLYADNANNVPAYARIALGVNTGSIGSESGYLCFSTINAGSLTEKMRITKEGNVGIGTTDTKGYMLAVNGSAIATSMTVKLQSNWPDYVFKPTYRLPTLCRNKNLHQPKSPFA